MGDPHYSLRSATQLARLVLGTTLDVRPGQSVTIDTWNATLPWASAFVLEAARLGARPVLLFQDEETFWRAVEDDSVDSLWSVGRAERAMLEKTDAYVHFWGPSDTLREQSMPEEMRSKLRAQDEKWWATANRAGVKLARFFVGRTNARAAARFGVDLNDWRKEQWQASLVDPVPMHRLGVRLAARLKNGKELTIRHPNGTNLRLRLKHRDPSVYGGIVRPTPNPSGGVLGKSRQLHETPIPSGYVVVALDEEFAEGKLVSNGLVESLSGLVWKGDWTFESGRLVDYAYTIGRESFEMDYTAGGIGRDRPGYLTIGINPKIRISPWMKDQRLGNLTLSIGGNGFYGGSSDCGFSAWLLLSGGEVKIDGRTVVRSGRVL